MLEEFLGMVNDKETVLAGMGNLGRALGAGRTVVASVAPSAPACLEMTSFAQTAGGDGDHDAVAAVGDGAEGRADRARATRSV